MINLIPANTKDLEYLWELVSERNRWFIKLRYYAMIMLFILYISISFFSDEELNSFQKSGIIAIIIITILYNIILNYIYNSDIIKNEINKFNQLKFSLIQIILDLSVLMILVYLTGLINSPFYLFFIFHAIIGSMILPGALVYLIVSIVILIISFLNIFVHYGLIPEFLISNSESVESLRMNYLILNLITFGLMMLVSVLFSNNLSVALFKRDQQLIEAISQIEASEKEKQKYVLAVVHEVKSPIAAIVSYLNLIINGITGEVNEKVLDILNKMKRRSEEAISLTNDIIEVSKIKLLEEIKKEELNPETFIFQMTEKMKEKISGAGLKFTLINDRKSERLINADRHLFEILFSNIISNSVKYNSDKGEILFRISENENNFCISISDSGIGIPKDELSKISTEFYRASNAKSNRIEGTGLGLYAVKQILENHNGKIEIISPSEIGNEKNPGTTILMEIPYKSVQSS